MAYFIEYVISVDTLSLWTYIFAKKIIFLLWIKRISSMLMNSDTLYIFDCSLVQITAYLTWLLLLSVLLYEVMASVSALSNSPSSSYVWPLTTASIYPFPFENHFIILTSSINYSNFVILFDYHSIKTLEAFLQLKISNEDSFESLKGWMLSMLDSI